MSTLNTEKSPPRWNGLKIGMPSRRMRFWSWAPPRTLNDAEKSEVETTPGSTSTARIGSASATPGTALSSATPSSRTVAPPTCSKRTRSLEAAAFTEMPWSSIARRASVTSTSTVAPSPSVIDSLCPS